MNDNELALGDVRVYQQLAMRTLAPAVKRGDKFIFKDSRSAMRWNAASGIASEAGEINEILKKHYFHFHPWTDETEVHLKKELGDLMWYVMLMCFAHVWNPAEILQMNIDKLRARYPKGFDPEKSMNRAEGDI